jgi:predicted PurR-regulated permease PerM
MPSTELFGNRYRVLAFWILAGGIVAASAVILLPFIPALLWAIVLSVLMFPFYDRWRKRFSRTRILGGERAGTAASLMTVLATIVIVIAPFILIGVGLFAQVGSIGTALAGEEGKPTLDAVLDQMDVAIAPFIDKVGGTFSVKEYVLSHKEQLTQSLRTPLTKFAGQAAFTLLTMVISLLSMFFMLRDGERMRQPALDLIPLPHEKTLEILHRVGETIRAVFVGTVLVALIQGFVMGIGLVIIGVPNSLLLGVLTAILGLIPLLGPPVMFIPLGVILIVQGQTNEGIAVLALGFAVVSQIDNFLRPFLIGGRVNLHPLAIFFSILGCVLWLGPIGIMAGPMLLTILLALIEAVRSWVSTPPVAEEQTAT